MNDPRDDVQFDLDVQQGEGSTWLLTLVCQNRGGMERLRDHLEGSRTPERALREFAVAFAEVLAQGVNWNIDLQADILGQLEALDEVAARVVREKLQEVHA